MQTVFCQRTLLSVSPLLSRAMLPYCQMVLSKGSNAPGFHFLCFFHEEALP